MRSATTDRRREPTRYCIAGCFAVAVAIASIAEPAGVVEDVLVRTGPLGLFGVDKWVHALSYGTLALLVAHAVRTRDRRVLTAVALAVVAFGGAIELIQGTLFWRSSESMDVLANAVGAGWVLVGWTTAGRVVSDPLDGRSVE